jgi:D-tagatose-1,6-bisphosphate aldolase subunit GatZ/KbaZ
MNNPLQKLLNTRTPDHSIGIPSLCSANEWVIDAGMLWAQKHQMPLLLEATANQVNQFGGYTGMTPQDFADFVKRRSLKNGFPLSALFLGGDHLGPMVWKNETADIAMAKAETLVRDFVIAGFTKIHLDASMPLAGDNIAQGMDPALVAARAARLAAVCEQAYASLHSKDSEAIPPIYVVGSEVPIAGGTHDGEDVISVTTPKNFHETVSLFQGAFAALGLQTAWERVVAVVVQPGVEFGNDSIMDYDAQAAATLSQALDDYPGLVFEGHSTDYQRPESLRAMIKDGIAILKVGPALTFALREGLYALQAMEKILLSDTPEKQSHYCEILEQAMLKNPNYWRSYFDGSETMLSLNRIFGLSDRSRYYLGDPAVRSAEKRLLENLSQTDIPLGLMHQFFPDQYRKVRENMLSTYPSALLLDKICVVLDDYR